MRKNNSRFLFVLASLLVVLVVAPDPVARYDVWDQAGYFGSVWVDKTNGHIFFYDMQL